MKNDYFLGRNRAQSAPGRLSGEGARQQGVVLPHDYPALLRARRSNFPTLMQHLLHHPACTRPSTGTPGMPVEVHIHAPEHYALRLRRSPHLYHEISKLLILSFTETVIISPDAIIGTF